MTEPTPRYVEPGWFTRNVFNRVVAGLTRAGVSSRTAGNGGTGERHAPVDATNVGRRLR